MTLDEFNTLQTLTALTTGCYMLKKLTDEMQCEIPDEIQESFRALQAVLDEIHEQIQTYATSRKSTYIDENEP